ncbi:hypothetical protein NW752_004160 [Fusarium irregulare]|nr:hypothetical protein NW752_004160 [Fusarium irregulare]
MTETRNALSMITKAGVPNNKIFVGESSYGRSFHMAKAGCWKPTCEFTGSKALSDATPGRCTKEGGYISNAEIQEILLSGEGIETMYDRTSESNILLYKGDYVSYMTDNDKLERRVIWTDFNFAGTIDWAVDLQRFGNEDFNAPPSIPESGYGCIRGDDMLDDSLDFCYFTCKYGFCPESICSCQEEGKLRKLPKVKNKDEVSADDPFNVDLNRLCKFACKYGYCPSEVCKRKSSNSGSVDVDVDETNGVITVPPDYDEDSVKTRDENDRMCYIYRVPNDREEGLESCKRQCQPTLDKAKEEGRTSNYGCVSWRPLDEPVVWQRQPATGLDIIGGQCSCDNYLLNLGMDMIVEALPAIGQIGCFLLMSSVKLILDIGLEFFPAGRAFTAGTDMLLTAAELINYVYPEGEDPAGAFEWWLSPCGGSDLVPDEFKQVFDILSLVPTGRSSYRTPKNIKKGSGKKGDDGNPTNRSAPRPIGGNKPPGGGKPNPTPTPKPKPLCTVPQALATQQTGVPRNTLRFVSCDKNDNTVTTDMVITTMTYVANAKTTDITRTCRNEHEQACYHYSSANSNNPHWSTLLCPQSAAKPSRVRKGPKATSTWATEHKGEGWKDENLRDTEDCDMDEWPPAYLIEKDSDTYQQAGKDRRGQRMRFLDAGHNRGAASYWRGFCFVDAIKGLSLKEFHDMVMAGKKGRWATNGNHKKTNVQVEIDIRPQFNLVYEFDQPGFVGNKLRDDGIWDNGCWPKKAAKSDPGFALLSLDEWYIKNPKAKVWDYTQKYLPNPGPGETKNGDP